MTDLALRVACPDEGSATRRAADLVQRRPEGCAHVCAPVQSRYHWRRRIEKQVVVPLELKTRAALVDRVRDAVRALRPCETPAIVALPILPADIDCAAWLAAETAGAA